MSKQDQIIQAYIADSEIFLNTASEDEQIRPLLQACGYDNAEFQIGYNLVAEAYGAFEARAEGMGIKEGGTIALQAAHKAAKDAYTQFRIIARASFPADPDQVALSISERIPDDIGKFITIANASYLAADKPPYSQKLTLRGYPHNRLEVNLADIKNLAAMAADHAEEKGDAIEDTATRDQHYEALKTYMKELKGTAKGALRGKPDLLAKLEF
jgi:hypothetical protein